ncbi:cytochrome P450 [Thozetella sp. PMI_491]|nr:cytochrome P450 [Thozetella sp. PMI_491]
MGPYIMKMPAILVLIALAIPVYGLYRYGFPRPIPGIPYNQEAADRFMGDYPEIKHSISNGQGYRNWLGKLSRRHNSPLVQIFLAPYARPCVVLSDYRESFDIIARRTKEFDRSGKTAATVRAIVPESLITMTTSDPRFKGNKELTRDLMSPKFLNEVSAPAIHEKVAQLVDVWTLKARLANGRPFEAYSDIHNVALDIIMAVTFGNDGQDGEGVTPTELRALKSMDPNELICPASNEAPMQFPQAPLSLDFDAVLAVKDAMRIGFSSPFPYTHIWLLKKLTKLGSLFAAKDRIIRERILGAVKRLFPSSELLTEKNAEARCAMDNMILREVSAARKEQRQPVFESGRLRDELFLYILGGHDTTATTFAWTVKTMADCLGPQHTLREHLYAVFNEARSSRRQPSVTEILTKPAPYLDAFLEEVLRYTRTIPLLLREALVDTEILGHQIPKGTTIILNTRSLTFVEPALAIPEHLRSTSSCAAKNTVGTWDESDMGDFEPMRWLRSPGGATKLSRNTEPTQDYSFSSSEFDSNAGPALTLGAGPRGCAGRRLAYMELRILLVLVTWNLQFDECPLELSSYDGTEYFTTVPKQCYVRLRELH